MTQNNTTHAFDLLADIALSLRQGGVESVRHGMEHTHYVADGIRATIEYMGNLYQVEIKPLVGGLKNDMA